MADTQNTGHPQENKKDRNKNVLIYGILILALIATWAYIYWDKSQNNQHKEELRAQVEQIDSSKVAIEQQFEATLVKLDMLKSENDSLMKTKSKEIDDLKARIQNILHKKNSSKADLEKARKLIARLKNQVAVYKNEIEKLKGEKVILTAQRDSIQSNLDTVSARNESLSARNDTLNRQISLASILHATNFDITPIHVKNSGKEKATNKAKRTDIIRISFELEKNLVTDSGQKELFICINNPQGTPIAIENKGSGKIGRASCR